MDGEKVATIVYVAIGTFVTLFSWPFLRGRWGSESTTGGSDLLNFLAWTALWPVLVLLSMILGFHYYKNAWTDYLMLRNKKKAHALRREFNERWEMASPADREKFGYEAKKAAMEAQANAFERVADDLWYRLDQQARKGLWFNPYKLH